MTHVGPDATATTGVATDTSMVEWSAVIAGAVAAAALSFVFLTFGSAIGLSASSPWPNSGLSSRTLASLAVFWTMAQQIGAFLIGGYIAGRLRSRWAGGTSDDRGFRDGLHGALVWAMGVAIGAAFLLSAAGAVARTGTDLAAKTASVAATSNTDPMDYYADVLFRPGTATTTTQRTESVPQETRAELRRVLSRAVANGALADSDRTYVASVVAQRTGLPQVEAEKRVADAYAEANRAARQAADKARRAAVLTGFVTAASLLISLAAAWWAAHRGGHHRDHAVPARFVMNAPRRA